MTADDKRERRQMRQQLYAEAKRTISLETRMGSTPAQIKAICRAKVDQAISEIVNAR